jgi:glycine cleavage system transcriptional repressor
MNERWYVVLIAHGPDRGGLVADLTAYVAARDGNVEDSRMAVLGGQFSIMMLVSGSATTIAGLQAGAGEIERRCGLHLTLIPTAAPSAAPGARRLTVTVEAVDREGIVHVVAGCLRDQGGNIVDLDAKAYRAPVSGSPLFRLAISVDVPHDAVQATREALAALADAEELDVDVAEARG